MNQIIIAGQPVSKIEYKDQSVVTFKMIDELHQRPDGTAKRNFSENRERFILNEDYFNVSYKEWNKINELRNSYCHVKNDSNNLTEHSGYKGEMIFLTQSGYLLLTKSLTDDLAWKVQRELVKHYFISQQIIHQIIHPRLTPVYKKLLFDLEYLKLHPETDEVWNPLRTLIYIDDERKPRRIPCKNHIAKVVMWLRQIGIVKGHFSQYSLHYEDKIFNNGCETHEWAKHFMDKYDFEDCFCGYSISQKILTKYADEIEQARIRKMEIRGCEVKKLLT